MKNVNGASIAFAVLGLAGVVWTIVDVVREGVDGVPGSTWVCGVLGLILAATALYRDFGGQPLVTVNPDHESEAQQFEDQKRRDGLA